MTLLLLRNKQKTLGGLFRDLGPFREGAFCALGPVRAFYPTCDITPLEIQKAVTAYAFLYDRLITSIPVRVQPIGPYRPTVSHSSPGC